MCITKAQIYELNDVINKLNSMQTEEEKDKYLERSVEDVDFFLETLRKVNKSKLGTRKKKSPASILNGSSYEKSEVISLFRENSLNDIVAENSKAELAAMYYAVYCAKPLSADNKEKIAQAIKGYIYDMGRADVLLR